MYRDIHKIQVTITAKIFYEYVRIFPLLLIFFSTVPDTWERPYALCIYLSLL